MALERTLRRSFEDLPLVGGGHQRVQGDHQERSCNTSEYRWYCWLLEGQSPRNAGLHCIWLHIRDIYIYLNSNNEHIYCKCSFLGNIICIKNSSCRRYCSTNWSRGEGAPVSACGRQRCLPSPAGRRALPREAECWCDPIGWLSGPTSAARCAAATAGQQWRMTSSRSVHSR